MDFVVFAKQTERSVRIPVARQRLRAVLQGRVGGDATRVAVGRASGKVIHGRIQLLRLRDAVAHVLVSGDGRVAVEALERLWHGDHRQVVLQGIVRGDEPGDFAANIQRHFVAGSGIFGATVQASEFPTMNALLRDEGSEILEPGRNGDFPQTATKVAKIDPQLRQSVGFEEAEGGVGRHLDPVRLPEEGRVRDLPESPANLGVAEQIGNVQKSEDFRVDLGR